MEQFDNTAVAAAAAEYAAVCAQDLEPDGNTELPRTSLLAKPKPEKRTAAAHERGQA